MGVWYVDPVRGDRNTAPPRQLPDFDAVAVVTDMTANKATPTITMVNCGSAMIVVVCSRKL